MPTSPAGPAGRTSVPDATVLLLPLDAPFVKGVLEVRPSNGRAKRHLAAQFAGTFYEALLEKRCPAGAAYEASLILHTEQQGSPMWLSPLIVVQEP